jgi:lipopolysaccharide transport system ATP-binding protein
MNTIRQLCTRCVVLDKGRVIYDGDVEEAINIYMQNAARNLQSEVDLSAKKRNLMEFGKNTKMTAFRFEGEGSPRIRLGQVIDFGLDIESVYLHREACFRCMVYYADGTAVCMASSCVGDIIIKEGMTTIRGIIDVSCLAPGSYYLKLAVYHVNEFGTEEHFDVLDKAVYFAIDDESVTNNMSWSHQWWGHVRLNDITIK